MLLSRLTIALVTELPIEEISSVPTLLFKLETSLPDFETSLFNFDTSLLNPDTSFFILDTLLFKLETLLFKLETSLLNPETSLLNFDSRVLIFLLISCLSLLMLLSRFTIAFVTLSPMLSILSFPIVSSSLLTLDEDPASTLSILFFNHSIEPVILLSLPIVLRISSLPIVDATLNVEPFFKPAMIRFDFSNTTSVSTLTFDDKELALE